MAKIFTRRIIYLAAVLSVVSVLLTDWSNYPGGLFIIGLQEDLGTGVLLAIAVRFVQLGWERVTNRGE